MTSRLFAVGFGASRPEALARFWAGVLGREPVDDGRTLPPSDANGFRIVFTLSQEPKAGQNRVHFDLTSSSWEDQQQTVSRALELGGRHVDVGQMPEEEHVVLADPEGNEFCVCEPTNTFLAGCGLVGALNCDGMPEVGYFWSRALGWPLVWDQDQETAIQAPDGGPKITWSGPPLMPRAGAERLWIELAVPVGGDRQAEIERLVALGASHVDGVLADPDGNEFRLVPA